MRIWPFRRRITYVIFIQHDAEYLVINYQGGLDEAERWREWTMAITGTGIFTPSFTIEIDPARIKHSFCLPK